MSRREVQSKGGGRRSSPEAVEGRGCAEENARRGCGRRWRSPRRAGTYSVGVGGDLYIAVDFAAAPAIGLRGPRGHPGRQLADLRGPAGPRRKDALSSGPGVRWVPAHGAQRPRSAALQPRAPPSSLRSPRRFLLPFLQTLLPFSRQQNLRSRLFVRERKGGQGPGEGEDGLSLCSLRLRAIAVKRGKS